MNRMFSGLGAAFLAVAMSACGSVAPTRYYALEAVAPVEASAHWSGSLMVARVSVPARLDRRQLVLGSGQIRVLELEQWAAPLGEDLGLVLALNLSHLLGAQQVAAWPQNVITDPDWRLYVDVAQFESQPGVSAQDEMIWSVRDRAGKTRASGRQTYQTPPKDGSLPALVAAHNQNLAKLASDIVPVLRGLPAQP